MEQSGLAGMSIAMAFCDTKNSLNYSPSWPLETSEFGPQKTTPGVPKAELATGPTCLGITLARSKNGTAWGAKSGVQKVYFPAASSYEKCLPSLNSSQWYYSSQRRYNRLKFSMVCDSSGW